MAPFGDALVGLAWGSGTLLFALLVARGLRRDRLIVHARRVPGGFHVSGSKCRDVGRALVIDYCRARLLMPPESAVPRRGRHAPPPTVYPSGTFWPDDDHAPAPAPP